eukprot:CCRYP_001376-RA/>CCRYP_001376-RA protein AED:0.84 eAED:0.45 QI:0/0/0/0.66/1/1/3/0/279
MPQSIIPKVDRHAKSDQAASRLVFGDRNNQAYKDVRNEEYNEELERLIEPEPSLFPDIPAEMPGVELMEHVENTAAITVPNAGLGMNELADLGPHLVEAEPEELDDDGSIYKMGEILPLEAQAAIEIDENSAAGTEDPDQGAANNPESGLLNHECNEMHEGEFSQILMQGQQTDGLLDQGADDDEQEEVDEDDEGVAPRRSKRNQKVSSRLKGFKHSMFTKYNKENVEAEVDEYMHATLSEEKCNKIDSYLVPIFEFIITQYLLKAGLKKAQGKDKKAI